MNGDRLITLLSKLQQGQLSAAERAELDLIIIEGNAGSVVDALEQMMDKSTVMDMDTTDQHWLEMAERLLAADRIDARYRTEPGKVRRLPFFRRWQAIAAAVLILVAGATVWFSVSNKKSDQSPANTVTSISPGTDKATLTLADGSVVTLDSGGQQVLKQGKTLVYQQGGQLKYSQTTNSNETSYNLLATPRGGQFRLVLPDGSKVWLNAASSIRYPVSFNDKERQVTITGEAYFEVAPQAGLPFIVAFTPSGTSGKGSVEVLGTSFNINAYENEGTVRTTLVTGAVRVSVPTGASPVLKPGQQARLEDGTFQVVTADNDEVLAWKNERFNFNGVSFAEAMRQLERWYDIEVVFEKGIPVTQFFGSLSRKTPLSGVLKALERSGVRCSLEGNKLIIKP